MKKLLVVALSIALSAPAFAAYYGVRNYCEDCVEFKYTTQDVLDPSWKAAGCEAHTVRDFVRTRKIYSIDVADKGYALFPQVSSVSPSDTTAIQPVSPANDVSVIQVVLPFQIKVSDIQIYVDTLQAGKNFGCGIYSADGETLLLETGAISTASAGKKKVTLGTAVTLDAGVYWYAWTADGTTLRVRGLAAAGAVNDLFDDTNPQMGDAENGGTNGVLPATLGTITYVGLNIPLSLTKP